MMRRWSLWRLPAMHVLVLALAPLAVGAGCQPRAASAPDAEAEGTASTPLATPPAPARSLEEQAADAARPRARAWLALIDAGQYAESWDAAANLFKSSVSKEQWQGAVAGARAPLGELGSRKFRAAKYEKELPNAPQGEYVVVYYDSSFAKRTTASESVTLRRAADDSWKVVGYFVQ